MSSFIAVLYNAKNVSYVSKTQRAVSSCNVSYGPKGAVYLSGVWVDGGSFGSPMVQTSFF